MEAANSSNARTVSPGAGAGNGNPGLTTVRSVCLFNRKLPRLTAVERDSGVGIDGKAWTRDAVRRGVLSGRYSSDDSRRQSQMPGSSARRQSHGQRVE